jgi:transcription initiation factor TFIIB
MQNVTQVEQGVCPKCNSPALIRDPEMGEIVCGKCGLVIIDDLLDKGPEWRAFTMEEKRKKRRTGTPTDYTQFDKGLSTLIRVDRDAFGRPLSPETRKQMWRLRKWQFRARMRTSHHRNLLHAMNELQRLSEKMHVPSSLQKMAAVIYRKALQKDLIKGRSIAAMVAAALYAACRFTKTPKTLKEATEASTRERSEVARSYRLLIRELEMEMPIHDPLNYISKVAEKANISGEAQGLAVEILRKAKEKHLIMGKDPMGVAAAVLYIACQIKDQDITQKEIAEAAGVTEVTIRNRKRELVEKISLTE